MTASDTLSAELRAEMSWLESDLRNRVAAQPAVDQAWRAEYQLALDAERTTESWEEWADDRVTQAAVAWVLVTVFIRFAEDNQLVKPVWISGPQSRRDEAFAAQAQFLRETARTNPDVTDREWLQAAVAYLRELPATRALVDETSALWLVTPSGDAASRLLSFWRERDENGELLRDLTDESLSTRFLGDLYQNLSLDAQERYALKQTPIFVEEFILDHTLEPALAERSLNGFKVIDPTCGSGHFLLGAFTRLLDRWHNESPALEPWARVQKALDAIHGVDLNPFAVAIARFRLTVAALVAGSIRQLEDAPAFKYHLAVGDSLLHGTEKNTLPGMDNTGNFLAGHSYSTENLNLLGEILQSEHYDVVVGNPPYIAINDKALKNAYRTRYNYCKGAFVYTVPFMERFFDLAKTGRTAGRVGQITSNSFMQRQFGKPLIERFFPTKDLTLVADTSGAFIPGHGTPTVIMIGRNRQPVTSTVRTVLGRRGEPGRPPGDPAKGKVWSSIAAHVGDPQYADEWVTVTDLERASLAKHPWSLSGGGAIELQQLIETTPRRLNALISRIGMFGDSHAEEIFAADPGALSRLGVSSNDIVSVNAGNGLRDWQMTATGELLLAPGPVTDPTPAPETERALWPWRTPLWARATFADGDYRAAGHHWLSWHQLSVTDPLQTHISFAKISTHNHFAIALSGLVEKPSSLRVELREGADESDHCGLLAVLNSSTACFWLKQKSHDKGIRGEGGGFTSDDWERFYEFTGTTLRQFPLPVDLPADRGLQLAQHAAHLADQAPAAVTAATTPTRAALDSACRNSEATLAAMVSLQEELDWEVYRLYGLTNEDLTYPGSDLPALALGERAFEIVLARQPSAEANGTTWFERHRSTPIQDIPQDWPAPYRKVVERRIALIEGNPALQLLEQPEYKRRWESELWGKREERALRSWLLDRLEHARFWFDSAGRPTPRSIAHLADDVSRDPDLVAVLALWEGRPDVSVTASLQRLLAEEAVPFLAAYRYKDSGLRTRAAWERTWAMQRQEDAGEKTGPIPVPPKYKAGDFARKEYWTHRGRNDVPKERFILYPGAGRDTDPTPVLGWAGWDHAQKALGLAQLIQSRESDGWSDDRLVPLVAGLSELQPWVEQWHSAPDPFYGGVSPAEFFREQLELLARQVGKTREQLADWRPVSTRRKAIS
ncbi:BREX-2 system adenine-specific DNA-methyltransferase PglX [Streptomyces sp. NPDC006704]|uniref:BREX-2 system adenine-specific DNA-methyltransferase PglX n=1 Tax=Streptomyces sp. NPDC006704 TaxID=3364760 RepID=UPI00367B19A9